MDDARLPLTWSARAEPLRVRAVAARGDAARALGRRVVALDDVALAALTAVAGDGLLIVLGDELPWVDGAVYLGRDPDAPGLLLPTALTPSVPAAVLDHALARRLEAAAAGAPLAVLPAPLAIAACGDARAIDRTRLRAWLGDADGNRGGGAP